MKRFAVYSACIGGYDEIRQPKVISDQFDYYLFTERQGNVEEQGNVKNGVWEVVGSPEKGDLSPILLARYIKTHPHELLPQYDAWIWVDLNLVFVDAFFYNRFHEWYAGINLIAANPHPATDDAYEHIYEMCCCGFEKDITCLKVMRYLQEQNYPTHNGLCETGVLFRKNEPRITSFNEQWWECITSLSIRDQFTFNFLLYKNGILCEYILPQNEPARVSSHLIYENHTSKANQKMVQMGFEERMRQKVRKRHPDIYIPFVDQYKRMSSHAAYPCSLRLWGWFRSPLVIFSYAYRLMRRKTLKCSMDIG